MQEKNSITTTSTIASTKSECSTRSESSVYFADRLPLQIIKSETIPPAPTRSESAVDWLPEFAGHSWIAYGASSLLVISHFPSPLSEEETLIGPIFRQVFELSADSSASVSAVSWSPATPSAGDLAAALDNCIGLFSHNSRVPDGSFSWSQTAVLVQSTKIETIRWTGSGDGIISGGLEVVLWRRKSTSWEIAWKFKTELPQTLLSTTFSIEGPSATAPLRELHIEESSSLSSEASKCVLLSYSDGKSSYMKTELHHPMPVSMIQWRPLIGKLILDARQSLRHVLLTCCLDGTVRLWCEINDGRYRRIGKEIHDQKTTKRSFHVAAVIEINQTLDGTLGSDIFVRWASECDGVLTSGKESCQSFSLGGHYLHERTGRCEWVIAFGPHMSVTFWAIHCLDDIAPVRFPRVTLWKRQEMKDAKMRTSGLLLNKVVILRSSLCGPPSLCSFLQLLPCNSLGWSVFNTKIPNNIEEKPLHKSGKEKFLTCYASGVLNIDGHRGKVLEVAVHPCWYNTEFAVSLDTDGLLLLWSLSTITNCVMELPTLNPSWRLSGKLVWQDSHTKYVSLTWAPSVLDDDLLLLLGHDQGIDCVMTKIFRNEEEMILYQNLCTIPFTSHSHRNGPKKVYSVPLRSTCKKTFSFNSFLLIAVWQNSFRAVSWKITVHSYDTDRSSCGCDFNTGKSVGNSSWGFESTFAGKRYYIAVDLCSSLLPDPHKEDEVTSFAVVSPSVSVFPEEQIWTSADELCCNYPAYHMATGCINGTLKLWKSILSKQLNSNLQWELVGTLAAHQGPISSISLTDCGRKIATICSGPSNTSDTVHIWECVNLVGVGIFLLEDKLFLDSEVVALKWLAMGGGQQLLGICLQNELRVYVERHSGARTLMKPEKFLGGNIWCCMAFSYTYPPIRDFLWGPRATAVVVYDGYFSLFSKWLFLAGNIEDKCNSELNQHDILNCKSASGRSTINAIFIAHDTCNCKESTEKEEWGSTLPMKMNIQNDVLSSIFAASAQLKCDSDIKDAFHSLQDVAEKLQQFLPLYHHEALLMNISSGHWKRAYVALRHLLEQLSSSIPPLKGYFPADSSHAISLIHLSNYLEGVLSTNSSDKAFQWSEDASFVTTHMQHPEHVNPFAHGLGSEYSSNTFSSSSVESELCSCTAAVEKLYDIAAISNTEKMQILAVVDLLQEVSNPQSSSAYKSLDEPGQRFWVAVRFRQLCFSRQFGASASVGELVFDSRLFSWAFHSDCQENLFGSLLPNEPSWQEMRNIGVGYWYTNAAQLRLKMEKLARQQYLKSKDPKACSLLYIALNRLQVLAGLFKISKDDKDKLLVGFLSRNFQEDKNKAAALKNAYVLMGRHQLELAVAFFLLGGEITSAVTVCAKNLGDDQLALVICRLIEGYGGPLERQLISKSLLPSAIEKGDFWLTSFLEWLLGNYVQSLVSMLGFQKDPPIENSFLLSNHSSFLDPSIGQYCLMLATKNSMKNAVGERNAAVLGRWAILITAIALKRCGFPIEALECISSPLSMWGVFDQGSISDFGEAEVLKTMLVPSLCTSPMNWISRDVAFHTEVHAKLDLAMHYISKLLREHPSWLDTNVSLADASKPSEYENQQYKIQLESFQQKLMAGLEYLENKFSLIPCHVINRIVIFLSNHGLLLMGYNILHGYASYYSSQARRVSFDGFLLYPIESKLLLKAIEELSCLFSRYMVSCCITCSQPMVCSTYSSAAGVNRLGLLTTWQFYMQGLLWSLRRLRSSLKLLSGSCADEFISMPTIVLDLSEYCIYFASAWLQGKYKVLFEVMKPLLLACTNGHAPYEITTADLKKLLLHIEELLVKTALNDNTGSSVDNVGAPSTGSTIFTQNHQNDIIMSSIPEDVRWQITRAALWGHISAFLKHQLNSLSGRLEDSYSFGPFYTLSSSMSNFNLFEHYSNDKHEHMRLVSMVLAKLLKTTYSQISSACIKQLASFLLLEMEDGSKELTLRWLEGFGDSHPGTLHKHHSQSVDRQDTMNMENDVSASKMLWDSFADPKVIYEGLAQENFKWQWYIMPKPSKEWSDIFVGITEECQAEESCYQEGRLSSSFTGSGIGSPVLGSTPSSHSFLSFGLPNKIIAENIMPFQSPKEVYRRNGELLEALCINSVDQKQAAVASNRKGIIFFNWEDELPYDYSNYIWAEADWPQNGWAGCESTPIPTCVSPGIGLGSKKGAQLGLGGATIGVVSLAKPGKHITGGGAFGTPSYVGMSASGLGWEVQEELEEFIDPPATVENINTRAFSSHPSRPFFLVGSSNTHIYLWEFGKDKARATYGVLPAANVPPPYALASVSALQFDHCGHRFATAALDGTVCTWQLEVGGRSNICPTESSLCFNNHALDVTYVTASGSIIAAAGYSSNGVNVVIWDTLAPPTTSRASIMCHEGGARSLSVFDNDIGSGSVSPFIVTGGKGGDVGLHDFRYIATGRTKRHKHFASGKVDSNSSLTADMQNRTGDQNRDGMLWYIPKAHLGSVTKISTIPNSSLFLTGSKDGDVKLWDAKTAKLVHHWPKLHERHTFLQPSSRVFGGVVRAAVTDIQVISGGFLTCGGDGSVKLVQLKGLQ
ncbi:uncharacterized protein LOC127801585 isoform X2 [Diospyros lotus]|uniref:uncharacterized protein LOC127801585 isoform X2 n=1 Tax=Diospyros lotus TaxID=55363 RepID=UPI0022564771|nr:uncharacterized protein LOC127801585 isoform X2 [Diospyros lotus]